MKFTVTGLSDIVCTGCGGTTRVAPKNVYDTDDLTCNCHVNEDGGDQGAKTTEDLSKIKYLESPYPMYQKSRCIEVVGELDGGVFVQNEGDDSDRWVIDIKTFSETYRFVEPKGTEAADTSSNKDENKDDEDQVPVPRENPNQAKMFQDDPEHVIDPKEVTMTEPEVREYLTALSWQELLIAAKNNEVTKTPSMKREELEELIIAKVFHE